MKVFKKTFKFFCDSCKQFAHTETQFCEQCGAETLRKATTEDYEKYEKEAIAESKETRKHIKEEHKHDAEIKKETERVEKEARKAEKEAAKAQKKSE
ncbi:MAG: hypothetical protein ACFE9J_11925 [Candidatus Hermodarchaeota archaeon]